MTVLVANLDVDSAHARLDAARRGASPRDPRFAVRPRALHRAAALGTLFGLRAAAGDTLWLPAAVDAARLPDVPGCIRPPIVTSDEPPSGDRWSRVDGAAVDANDRTRWCDAGLCVPGARVVTSMDELTAELPSGRWVLKAPFGAAGRRRVLGTGAGDEPLRAARALLGLFDRGVLEPWLDVEREIGAAVDRPGALPRFHRSVTGTDGRFLGIDLEAPEADEIAAARPIVAAVETGLRKVRYDGPFGLDLLVHRVDGASRVSLAEVNARWTFGALARDLARRVFGREDGVRFRVGREPPPDAVVLLRPGADDPVAAWLRAEPAPGRVS